MAHIASQLNDTGKDFKTFKSILEGIKNSKVTEDNLTQEHFLKQKEVLDFVNNQVSEKKRNLNHLQEKIRKMKAQALERYIEGHKLQSTVLELLEQNNRNIAQYTDQESSLNINDLSDIPSALSQLETQTNPPVYERQEHKMLESEVISKEKDINNVCWVN